MNKISKLITFSTALSSMLVVMFTLLRVSAMGFDLIIEPNAMIRIVEIFLLAVSSIFLLFILIDEIM